MSTTFTFGDVGSSPADISLTDLGGAGMHAASRPKFLRFHGVFSEKGQIIGGHVPFWGYRPRLGNLGSSTIFALQYFHAKI